VVRPAGLDELTAGADDRRYQRLAGTALLGMREPWLWSTLPALENSNWSITCIVSFAVSLQHVGQF